MKLRLVAPLVILIVAAAVASPAYANQGGKYHGGSDFGSRASIEGFATPGDPGDVIATARIQSGFTPTDGPSNALSGGDVWQGYNTSWNEASVTWNMAPTGTRVLSASLGPVVAGECYEVVTHVLFDGAYSFAITPPAGYAPNGLLGAIVTQHGSKDGNPTVLQPTLIVDR